MQDKKGRKCKNNNKNKKETNIKIFGNRFSRLQEVMQDNHEVMDMLEKAVDDTTHANTNINKEDEEETTKNMHNADTVDINTLDAEMQKYAKHDKKDNNKNKKETNIKIFSNRFSRLQEVAQDNHEVMDMLEKAVDDAKHANINKEEEEENEKDIHNADTVDMNALDAETQKYAEHDKNDNNENNETSENKENIENDENNDNNEGIQVHADLDVNQNESNEESEYDSEKERLEYWAMHPDSDSEYSDSDESVASDFELWNNNRMRHTLETYSE